MKQLIYIIILLFISQSVTADEPQWEFKIELSKENYLLEENIWLDVTITNISKDTLVSAQRIVEKGLGFTFIVLDSLGNKLENWAYYFGASYNPKAYYVAPGEELYRCYNLSHLFRTLPYTIGSYTIQGIIDLPFENECYFDDLTSNKLLFSIGKPTGIEKDAYKLKMEADSLRRDYQNITDQQVFNKHQEILDKFPKSVYAEESFRSIKREYLREVNNKDDTIDYIQVANNVLFQYPNSGNSLKRLGGILDIENSSYGRKRLVGKEKIRFLNGIIRVSPNTRLAKFSNLILQEDSRVEVSETCESVIDTIPKWDLKIELSKEKVFLHEQIWVDVTFTNISDDTLKADCSFYPQYNGFDLIITDSLGDTLEYTGMSFSRGAPVFAYLIPPGEKVIKRYNLLEMYHNDDFYLSIKKGGYSIHAINIKYYYNPYLFDNLISNNLVFSIVDLSTEEQIVFDLMEEARKLWRQKDTDLSGRKYQEIYDKYPNSVFAKKCFRNAKYYTNNAYSKGTLDKDALSIEMRRLFPNRQASKTEEQKTSKLKRKKVRM